MKKALYERLIAHVNRKQWWHVPPVDATAYAKRGKFLASTYAEAEFYGRPLDEPQRVKISRPLVGDEKSIARVLGIAPQFEGMGLEEIAKHDSVWRKAALKKGFDAILLMSPLCFREWRTGGKIPRSLELNVFNINGEKP